MIKAQFDKQEEAKKQAELERKREELAKQGIQNVPVVSQTGKVIGFVQSKNRYKYGAVVSPQIVPYNSENNFEKQIKTQNDNCLQLDNLIVCSV